MSCQCFLSLRSCEPDPDISSAALVAGESSTNHGWRQCEWESADASSLRDRQEARRALPHHQGRRHAGRFYAHAVPVGRGYGTAAFVVRHLENGDGAEFKGRQVPSLPEKAGSTAIGPYLAGGEGGGARISDAGRMRLAGLVLHPVEIGVKGRKYLQECSSLSLGMCWLSLQ